MPIDQPPAIEMPAQEVIFRFELKGEEPQRLPNNNIMFPSHWTAEQCDGWLDENTSPETRPGPPRPR